MSVGRVYSVEFQPLSNIEEKEALELCAGVAALQALTHGNLGDGTYTITIHARVTSGKVATHFMTLDKIE